MTDPLDRLTAIAAVVLALGEVDRATRHPDRERRETVTTHTVMLALCALDHARDLPGMDLATVVIFALVHDALEAFTGDYNTVLDLAAAQAAERADAEQHARNALCVRWRRSPWLLQHLDAYERQASPEARLVRAMDKLMPSLTHRLNGAAALWAEAHYWLTLPASPPNERRRSRDALDLAWEGLDMTPEQIDELARLVLRLAGRAV